MVDDQMFEEYKKFEEMYLMEKAQKNKDKNKTADNVILNDEVDGLLQISKINGDSAYGR